MPTLTGVSLVALAKSWLPDNLVSETVAVESAAFDEDTVRSFKISGLTYYYTNFVYYENAKKAFDKYDIPLTTSRIGIQYDGKMEIGVDASQMKVSQFGDRIIITLPKAKILSHEQVGPEVEKFNNQSAFNRVEYSDIRKAFDDEKAKMETRAIERNLLTTAEDNAARELKAFVYSLPGMGKYDVTVRIVSA